MGSLEHKTKNLTQAMKRFGEAVYYYQHGESIKINITEFFGPEELMLSLRDSMIQRFEFTIDLFWKFLKSYLEEKENIPVTPASPRATILAGTKAALLSENEGEFILEMFESRNLTSHVYQERIAESLAKKLPKYYNHLQPIFDRLTK